MPQGVYEPDSNEYQLFGLDIAAKQGATAKVGEDREEAIKQFKTAATDSSKIVALIDKGGRGFKFSGNSKPELYI